ncbi:transglutaminase domain-containing protein [Leeuwenhoekiella marinoflava]|uniref:Transglutaminase superfamily protein n=2 Tax=Leeuwenhoekiella marinoflava TaxID=988 RepID=A0A4Q0PMR2_9FLAO|nr:transglutaminase domain-containing protein [Leeuwenhoekiella marinoflava]RXG31757.1 transglutaminase superfamily protein [Leeuwenhoekiella marinoflava]SHF06138.1 Transglutaminase-like superfamily protein [Leeuwenhoekiella marinoflava DSM 3653]
MHKITCIALFLVSSICFAQDFRFGKVSLEELQEEFHPEDPEADAAILYREQSSHIDYSQSSGFVLKTEVYERIKIYNSDGFDWATQQVLLYQGSSSEESISGLKGVTYTIEGSDIAETKMRKDGIFSEERNKYFNIEKFTLPNLQKGCVLEFKYEVMSPFISTIDEVKLQEEIPLNVARITFTSPEWLIYQMHRKGLLPLDVNETTTADKVIYTVRPGISSGGSLRTGERGSIQNRTIDFQRKGNTIEASNVPALKEEVFSSNIDNYRSAISFELSYTHYPGEPFETITSSWDAVSKTIYDSDNFGGQLKNQRFFDDDINAVLEGAGSSEEKVVRIFEYVKQRMSWNNFLGIYADEGVKEAYKTGSGNSADINLLLVSMLQYAGLDANPVILSTRDNGIPVFPTRDGFNHVIAGVGLDGKIVLMDATNKLGAVNLLEEGLLNWQGRLIRKDGSSEWVSLYPTSHATESTMVNFEIGEDLLTTGSAKSRYTGHYGLSYRRKFKGKTEQEHLEELEEIHGGVEINDFELRNIDNVYEPVEVSYEFEMLNGGVEEVAGKLYVSPLFYLTQTENPFKSEERNHPIDFRYPWKDRYILKIKIPEGYSVESLPENGVMRMVDNLGSFKYLISEVTGGINISTEFSLNSSIIPAELYLDLKKFYEMIVSKESEKIVLSKI